MQINLTQNLIILKWKAEFWRDLSWKNRQGAFLPSFPVQNKRLKQTKNTLALGVPVFVEHWGDN